MNYSLSPSSLAFYAYKLFHISCDFFSKFSDILSIMWEIYKEISEMFFNTSEIFNL
ncbi:hypothetical protein HMPREF9999_02358 [Alloprevotella sp. oral taxon 473 str. F0040]|nr:hypothetical protein HMPREF9999_02358 [Alloprevotella sp. oral taxon 473 str. F0040]